MKRWKNIIDNYKKTERKKDKSGQGALSGRRYLYARQLSFLQQTIEAVPTENSIVEEEENENDNNDDSISPHKHSSDLATSTGYGSNPSGSPSGPSNTTLSPYGSSSVNSNYGDSMDIFGSEYSTN
ncbi:hypothetical protein J6590_087462 [Homalodisca vitripennis]|nr:hypothetical protein J6590_087462 [Homalodisca vitripennis]